MMSMTGWTCSGEKASFMVSGAVIDIGSPGCSSNSDSFMTDSWKRALFHRSLGSSRGPPKSPTDRVP